MTLTRTGLPRILAVLSLVVGVSAVILAVADGPSIPTVALALIGVLGFAFLWLLSDVVDLLAAIHSEVKHRRRQALP